jgi:hypothetical protein
LQGGLQGGAGESVILNDEQPDLQFFRVHSQSMVENSWESP